MAPPKGESITNANAMVMGDTFIKPFLEKKFMSAVLFEFNVNLYDVFRYLGPPRSTLSSKWRVMIWWNEDSRREHRAGSHKSKSLKATAVRFYHWSMPFLGACPFSCTPPPPPPCLYIMIQKNEYVWQVLSFDLHQSQSSINKQENNNCNNYQIMSAFQLNH